MLSRLPKNEDSQFPSLDTRTGLRSLHMSGDIEATIPDGGYLSKLKKLDWVCSTRVCVPEFLTSATALQELRIGLGSDAVRDCAVLRQLPSLRKLICVVRAHDEGHKRAVRELRTRLHLVDVVGEFDNLLTTSGYTLPPVQWCVLAHGDELAEPLAPIAAIFFEA